MENNVRFRNHISIVAERLGRGLLFLGVAFIGGLTQLAQDVEKILSDMTISGEEVREILLVVIALSAALALLVVWQVVVWSKTYISICDNTIVIERNTLNRKKNTIGIKNISNVNMEQNLFEMIMGTRKVKLDTNSLSTADRTDVKILLKKEDARKFCEYLTDLMEQTKGNQRPEIPVSVVEESMEYDVQAAFADMLVHGFFSINLFSVLVVTGCIVGLVEMVSDTFGSASVEKSIAGILIEVFLVFTFFVSAFWDIVKGFIKYYEFKVKRTDDRLCISYGILKKVNYTIPVDKINGLKLTQSLLGRMTGRYMAEIINVGMGDDEEEKKSFLVLYCKKKELRRKMELLLPEFSEVLDVPVERQPKTVWLAWMPPLIIYAGVTGITAWAAGMILPEYRIWMLAGMAGMWGIALLFLALRYMTAGCAVGSEYLMLVNGYCGRTFTYVSYDRIQYIQLTQNFLARRASIQKGTLFLLASAANKVQSLPYFFSNQVDTIKANMLR